MDASVLLALINGKSKATTGVSGTGMEISIIGKIRTPFGEVRLVPQDRNLLEASSVAPLQFADVRIHLWSLLERIHGTWGISDVVEPVLHLIDRSGSTSSIADESIA